MSGTIWRRFHLWLAIGLVSALVLDGVAASALAAGDDVTWEEDAGAWDGDDDDSDDGDDGDDRGNRDRGDGSARAQAGADVLPDRTRRSRKSSRTRRSRAEARSGAAVVQAAGDDDDDACEIDDDGDTGTDGFCADQAIVRLDAGADIDAVNDRFGTETIATIAGQPLHLLALAPGSDELAVIASLEGDSGVRWAELNVVDQAPEGRPQRFFPRGQEPVAGSLSEAYAPEHIGLADANRCLSGAGVTVAVIDTGIDPDHPAFAETTMRDPWNAFSDQSGPGNVDDIGNAEDDDGDRLVDEMTGHGSHVAGIIVQAAPGATIMPVKALDSDGVGQAFYLARAIHYTIDRNAAIINLSVGSTADVRIVREATEDAVAAGIFVAAAAGNGGVTGPREYPATLDGVFGVAATDRQDRPTTFTSTHPSIDLSAPGQDVVSAFPLDQPANAPLGSVYALWSGTSMAAPWVAGTAALLLQQKPAWDAGMVAERLRSTADPIVDGVSGMGGGRLDAGAATGCSPDDEETVQKDKKKDKKKGKKKRKNRRR